MRRSTIAIRSSTMLSSTTNPSALSAHRTTVIEDRQAVVQRVPPHGTIAFGHDTDVPDVVEEVVRGTPQPNPESADRNTPVALAQARYQGDVREGGMGQGAVVVSRCTAVP